MNTCFHNNRRAFTLIELLIVVAIIAILAAIAVPNFLEAHTRARISGFMSDMRACANALEAYRVDNISYPPADAVPVGEAGNWRARPEEAGEGFMPRRLTTPIAYIATLPNDIFPDQEKHVPFHPPHYSNDEFNQFLFAAPDNFYVARLSAGVRLARDPQPHEYDFRMIWAAYSHGPDGQHHDFESEQGFPVMYDPTNGTISEGDIIYFGPGGFR